MLDLKEKGWRDDGESGPVDDKVGDCEDRLDH